jgi:hypothetical protein
LSCCIASPAPSAVAGYGVLARPRDQGLPFGTPDLVVLPASPVEIRDSKRFDPSAAPIALRLAWVPEPLYLLTRRLRL